MTVAFKYNVQQTKFSVKNLSLKNASYVEHEGLRDSTLFFTFWVWVRFNTVFHILGIGIFLSIEFNSFKRNGAAWGSFNTENSISNFVSDSILGYQAKFMSHCGLFREVTARQCLQVIIVLVYSKY